MTAYQQLQKQKSILIPRCCSGDISINECAKRLNITARSVCRLKARYKKFGKKIFINGHKGQIPANKKITKEFENKIINIYINNWNYCNFLFFRDILFSYYNIYISYPTLLQIFKNNKIKSPRNYNTKEKKIFTERNRRACAGDMLQLDASTHDWFMNNTKVSLHGAIDDATNIVTGLYFCDNECRLGYNEVLRQTFTNYGIFRAAYIDRHSSFVTNSKTKNKTLEELLEDSKNSNTHFIKLCEKLKIEIILALSPQGKGRIERLWQTLQGRLPFIFRYLKINTIDKANQFLKEYLKEFNFKFSKNPMSFNRTFKPLPDTFNLEYELALKFPCRTKHDGSFLFHGYDFFLKSNFSACKKFELCLSEEFGIKAYMNNAFYDIELAGPILDIVGDAMPIVEKNLIRKYLQNDIHNNYYCG